MICKRFSEPLILALKQCLLHEFNVLEQVLKLSSIIKSRILKCRDLEKVFFMHVQFKVMFRVPPVFVTKLEIP